MSGRRWGVGVVVACAVFVAGILAMVVLAVTERFDLVTDRYYEQGLQYQETIEARRNTVGDEAPKVGVLPDAVTLAFPPADALSRPAGTIAFYRPADRSQDFTAVIDVDDEGRQRIPTARCERGFWRIKVSWTRAGVAHYHEEAVMIR